ncbi:MAG TPA: hypothetical protein VL689_10330 [Paraburkholderia sp.]|jgi:hypothetical protein|nr:hypothetical protein [Paraburkholderia sp.]
MPSPTGSVVAISSSASTIFSLGIVFLGYWGVHETGPWRPLDYLVLLLALAGFVCLAAVPWLATGSVPADDSDRGVRKARRFFAAGVGAVWLAVAISVLT